MRRTIVIAAVCVLVVLLVVTAYGCGQSGDEADEKDSGKQTETDVTDDSGDGKPEPSTTGRTVIMCGRSVMGDWFQHWGWDWEGDVQKEGYTLRYGELDADLSNIADSFRAIVDEIPEGESPVVFFKFCFVDFGDNLSQLEEIIGEVVEIASERGHKLVIGNALPVNAESTESELVDLHRDYNSFLEGVAAENQGSVYIFNFYGSLTDSSGELKTQYDVGDSHLTDEAYEVLDKTFFPLLDRVFQ